MKKPQIMKRPTLTKINPDEFPPSMWHLLPFIEERFLDGTEVEYRSLVSYGHYEHIEPEQLAQHPYEIIDIKVSPGGGGPVATYMVNVRNLDNDLKKTIPGNFAESWIPHFGDKRLGIDVVRTGPSELGGYDRFSQYLTQTFRGVQFDGVSIDFSEEQWKKHSEITKIENYLQPNEIGPHREWVSQQYREGKKLGLPIGVLI